MTPSAVANGRAPDKDVVTEAPGPGAPLASAAAFGCLAVAMIALAEVTKRFGERLAVDRVSFTVPAGACFGLLGPNGAGKTTTLRMVYGVTAPDAGTVRVFGLDVARDPRAVRARLGVTLQESVLIDVLSPVQNLRVFGRYHRLARHELESRIEELLDFLELRSHAQVPVKHLSGGFKRRAAIAQSLLNRPELLILDEPTTGLDPAVRLALWQRVRTLQAGGTTVLLTTHYMDEAERLCDRVAIMSAGRIVADDAPRTLIRTHLAASAVEVEGALGSDPDARHTMALGGRTVFYVDDPAPMLARVQRVEGRVRRPLAVRPTNLEDVFLKLTGARLEEGA
jgi:lipooligosaccharide transport system ATP-binding protein